MTIDITKRLEEVAADKTQDRATARIMKILDTQLAKMSHADQMTVLCAYQAGIIMDMAEGDEDAATDIWRSAWAMSAQLLRQFTQPTNH